MKSKLTWKIWLLLIVLAMSLISIFGLPPKFLQNGMEIKSIVANSTAFEQGLRQGQIITGIDEKPINNLEDFSNAFKGKFDSGVAKTIIQIEDSEIILFTDHPPEITVSEIPKTNLKTGLDLAGGSRAYVQAEKKQLSKDEISELVDVINNRLNVYGITDLRVVPVSDLFSNRYIKIEIAGTTPEDLEELISKQGKFEARIGNDTVFIGGERDISYVCRSGDCSRVEIPKQFNDGYASRFAFEITLSEAAAQKHADITSKLDTNIENPGYLSEKLDLYLDDTLVDSLLISEGLKGRVETQIQISGSGTGANQEEAVEDAQESMRKLQTVLITGSLPYKLEIVKLDTISPRLGKEFIQTILLAGISAIIVVALVVLFRYRKLKSSLALVITSFSEIVIILGIASFINWNLDLPSIAGILVTIGTGIDQQIIILDEARQKTILSIKQKMKRAFSIILGAYFTALVAVLPLYWAVGDLFKGFAITTIIGITIGVSITRPAFTDMIKRIEE